MISLILWLVFGALVGWLASIVMHRDGSQGTFLNIVVGIVGAFIGGMVFNYLGYNGANLNDNGISIYSLLVSLIGAIILLGVVNLFQRGRVR